MINTNRSNENINNTGGQKPNLMKKVRNIATVAALAISSLLTPEIFNVNNHVGSHVAEASEVAQELYFGSNLFEAFGDVETQGSKFSSNLKTAIDNMSLSQMSDIFTNIKNEFYKVRTYHPYFHQGRFAEIQTSDGNISVTTFQRADKSTKYSTTNSHIKDVNANNLREDYRITISYQVSILNAFLEALRNHLHNGKKFETTYQGDPEIYTDNLKQLIADVESYREKIKGDFKTFEAFEKEYQKTITILGDRRKVKQIYGGNGSSSLPQQVTPQPTAGIEHITVPGIGGAAYSYSNHRR